MSSRAELDDRGRVEIDLPLADAGEPEGGRGATSLTSIQLPETKSGDLVAVEVVRLEVSDERASGWSRLTPESHPVCESLSSTHTVEWTLRGDGFAISPDLPGVAISPNLHLGTVGLADGDGELGARCHGVRQGGAGARWLLPAAAGSTLVLGQPTFACGDGIGAGGIDIAARAELKVTVIEDGPELGADARLVSRDSYFQDPAAAIPDRLKITLGNELVAEDACSAALRDMAAYLQARDFSLADALTICAVAVDLRMSQVVNIPYTTVAALLPLDVLY